MEDQGKSPSVVDMIDDSSITLTVTHLTHSGPSDWSVVRDMQNPAEPPSLFLLSHMAGIPWLSAEGRKYTIYWKDPVILE